MTIIRRTVAVYVLAVCSTVGEVLNGINSGL